jgi:hypothetical protein
LISVRVKPSSIVNVRPSACRPVGTIFLSSGH